MKCWMLMGLVGSVSFPAHGWAGDQLAAARREVTEAEPRAAAVDEDSWDAEADGPDLAPGDDAQSPRFLAYPYAAGRRGYIVRARDPASKDLGFHIQAEGAYLYEDVWRTAAVVRAAQSRLYLQGSYDLMLEGPRPVLDGDLEVRGRVFDRLHFISFEVGAQLSPSPVVAFRVAPVLTVMFDDQRSTAQRPLVAPWLGWSAGLDVFPVRPLVVRGRAAIHGTFGTTMLQLRATAGVTLGRVELYAGYDQRWVGSVGLGGPTAGLAVRF